MGFRGGTEGGSSSRAQPRSAPRARRRIIGGRSLALAIAALAAVGFGAWLGAGSYPDHAAAQGRPNVVVVMTDDQTVRDLKFMPLVQRDLVKQGTTFRKSFVNDSLCCPSRATYMTGEYAHNDGVTSGFGYFQFNPGNALPVWLERAGYRTALAGKYLNGYGVPPPRCARNQGRPGCHPLAFYRRQVPPGWSQWYGAITSNDQAVYNYTLNENGTIVRYGAQPADFKQDVLTSKALGFINQSAGSGPFYLSVAYTAPHRASPNVPANVCPNAAKPAPADVGAFANEPLPEPPSFNERHVSDKPQAIRSLPKLSPAVIARITAAYRCRLASLQSVDRGVDAIVGALRDTGQLGNTMIIFTSDNGYMQGQHRIITGKVVPYEESIRVPLVIRGPGFPAGKKVSRPVINADLAPTILDATGAHAGLREDGKSLLNLIKHPKKRDFPIESYASPRHSGYFGVRTPRYLFVQYPNGQRETYDLSQDPYELHNLHGVHSYRPVRRWLIDRLARVRKCRGKGCRKWTGKPPPPRLHAVITSGPASGAVLKSGAPTWRLHSSVPGGRLECRIDRGPRRPCRSPFTPRRPLAAGRHTLTVTASDAAHDPSSPRRRTFSVR